MELKKSTLSTLMTAALVAFCPNLSEAAVKRVALGKSRVQTITVSGKRYTCGVPSKKWVPVKKAGSKYDLISGTTAHKNACKTLIARGTLKRLTQLPDVNDITKARVGAATGPALGQAVSGTAPIISAIPALDAKALYWRAGVVDAIATGAPTAEQCNEFWGSPVDGESSGQTSCFMIQNVGEAFQVLTEAGTSLCYMRSVPTLSSDAIQLTSGTLPSGGISRLFDTPSSGSSRLVKAEMGSGQAQFIRIFGQTALDAAGAQYKFQTWSCNGSTVGSAETVTVKINGEFVAQMTHRGENSDSVSTVRGFLTPGTGTLAFDTARTRTVELARGENSGSFKAKLSITPDDEIVARHFADRGGEQSRAYSIAHFSGSSLADLRFLEGSIKMHFGAIDSGQSFQGGSEYRDTFYGSAPSTDYATRVTAFDISGDSYFSSVSAPDMDLSDFDCSATPNIRVAMDMNSTEFTAVRNECESARLDGFDMCRSDTTISAAMSRYNSVCSD